MKQIKLIIACALLISLTANVSAQSRASAISGQNKNFISTGMPILLIASDAISGAMGDVGAATTPDMYSGHWNNAKFAFIDDKLGVSTTYTPWLRNIGVGDMNLLYLSIYKKINARSTFAASVTYFSLGDIDGADEQGNLTLTMHPNEFAADATYAMKLGDELSIAATGRFIRSDLTNGQDISDGSSRSTTKPANSFAADLGMYWQHDLDNNQQVAVGGFISNLGAKLSYSDDDTHKEFLPTNLRIGARYTTDNQVDTVAFAIGTRGTTIARLAPTGKALLDGQLVEVHAINKFIDPDRPIEVVAVEGYRIDVCEIEDNRFDQ